MFLVVVAFQSCVHVCVRVCVCVCVCVCVFVCVCVCSCVCVCVCSCVCWCVCVCSCVCVHVCVCVCVRVCVCVCVCVCICLIVLFLSFSFSPPTPTPFFSSSFPLLSFTRRVTFYQVLISWSAVPQRSSELVTCFSRVNWWTRLFRRSSVGNAGSPKSVKLSCRKKQKQKQRENKSRKDRSLPVEGREAMQDYDLS